MHTDKAIAEFEAWAGSEAFGLSPAHFAKDEAGDYINYPTQCYWLVWQASRREAFIELPRLPRAYPPNEASSDVDYWIDEAKWDMWTGCKRAIEAAGVRVKE